MSLANNHRNRGLGERSWPAHLALVCALMLAVVGADADGPPAGVNGEAWASIQEQIEVERHRVVESDSPGRLYRADNDAQRFTAHFGSEGVVLVDRGRGEPAWQLSMRLTAWGAAHDLQPAHPGAAFAEGNRVEFRRGPLTEWYVNTTMGLEQGFTIDAPPAGDITELVLEMTLDGNLTPLLTGSGNAVTFRCESSNVTLTYSGLTAWDAVTKPLGTRMELAENGTRLRLVISVADAAWPITIDPTLAQVAKLLPTPDLDASEARFSRSAAMDGDLMVVGLLDLSLGEDSGAVHIFRSDQGGAGTWGHVAKITASDGAAYDYFGDSVAISSDTVIVGAPGDENNGSYSGSAYVFQRDHGEPDVWNQVARITPVDGAALDHFGRSVAISGDTAVIGAPGDDDVGESSGSVYLVQRDQGGAHAWGQVAKITPTDDEGVLNFGGSVAISGNTAVIGAPLDDHNGLFSGSAYVLQRDQGGSVAWGQVTKLTASDGASHDNFGASVSVWNDTAVIGATGDNSNAGSAYVFQRDEGGPDGWGQAAKITASDGSSEDRFGKSISINGDTTIVGAYGDNDNGFSEGSAYIFQRDQGGPNAWGQVVKITATDAAQDDLFGYSAAISGDTAVVGSFGDDDSGHNSGSAYLFQRDHGGTDAWGQLAKLPCPPVFGARGDFFGSSVSISGDTAVVGANGDDDRGSSSGSAYIFRYDQGGPGAWVQVAKIAPTDGSEEDHFGYSVSISGATAVVGASGDDDNGSNSGSAYVFQRDHGGPDFWGQVAKVAPTDGSEDDRFGYSVSISGDTVAVGSFQDDDNGSNSGSAYLFQRDHGGPGAWGKVAKITPEESASGDHFGFSVAIDEDSVVVGAEGSDDNDSDSGSAYVFRRDHGGPDFWGQVARITPTDAEAYDHFGRSVSLSGDTTIVGAPGDDDDGDWSGSAYIFQRDDGGPNAWGQVAKITASDGESLDQFGSSVAFSGDTIVIGARGDDDNGSSSGSTYLFFRDHGGPGAWGQVAKIAPADGGQGDYFGWSTSITGNTVVVGAPGSASVGDTAGAAYFYTISDAFFAAGFETGDTSEWSVTVP